MLLNKFYTRRIRRVLLFHGNIDKMVVYQSLGGGNLMDKLEILKKWIEESNRIVFFGGAGVSTEIG